MFTKKRPDGTYIKGLHFFTQLLPYLLPTRTEACIFFEQEIDLTHTLEYVRKKRSSSGVTISIFYLMLYAATRAIALRPRMNRFVSGCRYYQRNRISYNFVAKRDLSDDGEEVNVTMSFSPLLSLEAFCKKIDGYINSLKMGEAASSEDVNSMVTRLPRFCIKLAIWGLKFLDRNNALPKAAIDSLPFFSTIFFTNVGSVGIDAPFHHNFEIGNCGIFCAIGKLRKDRSIGPDGTVRTRDKVKLIWNYDDRISDGIYCARSLAMMRDLVENPEKMETPLELTPEQLASLGLAASELETES
jgi:hypothetical protein